LIDSLIVSLMLTSVFGAAALMLGTPNVGARPPAISDRLSRGIHLAGCAAMIIMAWPHGLRLPVWPQEAAFTVAAGWFFARAARGPLDRAKSASPRWRDLHHSAMAGAVAWSIAATTDPQPMMEHGTASGPTGDVFTAGLLALFFGLAAWPWLSMVMRAVRNRGNLPPGSRRQAVEPAGHAIMSIGMAVMFFVMA
jgi:hypothetical protein